MTDETKGSATPSGAQTESAASPVELGAKQSTEAGDAADLAWQQFPDHVRAAIEYAGENRYDYGPKYRNLELEHSVVSARQMTDEITRVVLAYRPITKFKGESGTEYMDVDAGGEIMARRQIRVPKESMPWVLVSLATISVIAAAVLVPLIVLTEPQGDPTYVAGRTLWVRAGQPKIGPYVSYNSVDAEGIPRTWIIDPEGDGTQIAFVKLTVINQTSGVVSLAINNEAAEVTTEDGVSVGPVDIFDRVVALTEGRTLDQRLSIPELPLWGDRELKSGHQLEGFMAFELPAGSRITSLRWTATDIALIRY